MPRPRIAYVFTSGRRERSQGAPSELLYGMRELEARGWDVTLLEEGDLFPSKSTLPMRALARLLPTPIGLQPSRMLGVAASSLRELNTFDAVVATNQFHGLDLSVLKSLGALRPPLFAFIMGLLPLARSRVVEATLRAVYRRTTIVAISRGEQAIVRERLGPSIDVRYVPFGADARFWTPADSLGPRDRYAISVGNDPNRDFDLLMDVWRPEWPKLVVVTSTKLKPSRGHVEIIAGHYNRQLITDAEMRDLVRGAELAVIPVRETLQPSGQSAAVQAMACGVPLVVSRTLGLWDEAVMRDGESCLLVENGARASLEAAIQKLLDSSDLRARIGAGGRRAIETDLNADAMGDALDALLLEATSARRASHHASAPRP